VGLLVFVVTLIMKNKRDKRSQAEELPK
jgi:hypothetical protein